VSAAPALPAGGPFTAEFYVDAIARPSPDPARLREAGERALPQALCAAAQADIARWPGYAPTPLVRLPQLASELGIGQLYCKDESGRFGLGSFKALGGAYAVERLAAGAGGPLTVACATEGNHGRSVAWGARRAGARCVIFLHRNVSAGREQAIAVHGAEIRRVDGNYDDAVRECAEVAGREGWTIVSDTTWPGYDRIPRIVMAGYSIMTAEMAGALDAAPTHAILQGGVGGMAAAVMADLARRYGADTPRFVIVEPRHAACLLASLRAGTPTPVRGELRTVMAGLACGEASPLAFDVVAQGAGMALAVDDERVVRAMRRLARPAGADPAIVSGPSGAAGLGGLLALADSAALREAAGLTPASRVLVVSTEGDTDPQAYRQLIGD